MLPLPSFGSGKKGLSLSPSPPSEVIFEPGATVVVVDDDPDMRDSLGRLLQSVGLNVQLFASVPDFLNRRSPKGPMCLVLDVDCQGGAVWNSSANSRLRTSKSRSSSSRGTVIFR